MAAPRGNHNTLGKHWKVKDTSKMRHKRTTPIWNKDKKMTEEQKKNMFHGGMLGKHHSDDTIKKIKEAKRKNPCRGESSSNWQGGITKLTKLIRSCFKYRQWRSDVFTRDDFTCRLCGKSGCYLEADHYPKRFSEIIKEYQIKTLEEALGCEELWNINGGRTLCKNCHITKTLWGRNKNVVI
jgi:hypothetical protein